MNDKSGLFQSQRELTSSLVRKPCAMPRTYSNLEKLRAELTWVNETPDPNRCGCRNVRCCEEMQHQPGACAGIVATRFWTFRWEYYCQACREYGWCGSKARGYMTAG